MSTLDIAFEGIVPLQTDVFIQAKNLKLTYSYIYIYIYVCVCVCVCVCARARARVVRSIVCEYKSIYIFVRVCVCVCVFEIFALSKQFSLLPPHRKKVPLNFIQLQSSFININFNWRNTVKREQLAKQDRFSVVLEVCVLTSLQSWQCTLRSRTQVA